MSARETAQQADNRTFVARADASTNSGEGIREASVVDFAGAMKSADGQADIVRARGQNFLVEWLRFRPGGDMKIGAADEMIVVAPYARMELDWKGESGLGVGLSSVAVTPAGEGRIVAPQGGVAVTISPVRDDDPGETHNGGTYATPDPRVRRLHEPSRRVGAPGVSVIDVDTIRPPADRPRLRMLRSASMSINWVKYQGPRDRRQLSPHSHEDFEQGSLALSGNFVHHLRVPWGRDATTWQPDRHVRAGSPSLIVIPPHVVHTTEGLGEDEHLLIDIFAPPRADFLERGWIANAADYV